MFEAIHVVHEKDAPVLRELIETHGLAPERTWMIGNSPRSDINPATEAGIGAIHIPHEMTWDMEQEAIAAPDQVVELGSFRELRELFGAMEGEVR
jgi:putative hydrolase of the HAD superfamily